ncbi:hypothetical protein NHP164001_21460 [Helicobacter trogontum]|uniref:Uncharacterized protein n=1 Tax=Helicobacter trogontum TaxID=50960 RepID=A0ABQ0D6Z0_9HELI
MTKVIYGVIFLTYISQASDALTLIQLLIEENYTQEVKERYYRQEARKYYKVWGFDYCLNYTKGLSNNHANRSDSYARELVLEVGGKQAVAKLKKFIEPRKKDSSLTYCLELYESKEYQDEVERIVKKYCKECK